MRPFKIHIMLALFALIIAFMLPSCGGGDTNGAPASLPPGIDTGRITGRVTELITLDTGAGRVAGRTAAAQGSFEGYIVTIPGTNLSTTTDAAGNFTLSYVPKGRNTMIVVTDPTGTRVAKKLVHIDTRQTADVTLDAASTLQTLLAEQLAASLKSLISTYSGMTTEQVLAQIEDDEIAALLIAADTNGDGEVTLADFDADGSGTVSDTEVTDVVDGDPITDIVDDALAAVGANVRGTVSDKTTAAPVSGALVKIYATNYSGLTLTDASGRYAFFNVPAGTYYVIATKSGYTLETKTVTVH